MRKDFAPSLNAILDAIASGLSLEPANRSDERASRNDARVEQGPHSGSARESSHRLRSATQSVSIVLGIIVTATVAISIADLLSPTTPVQGQSHAWVDWRQYRVFAAIAMLLFTEWALIAALYVQDLWRQKLERLLVEGEERIAFAAEAADMGLWRWDADTDDFWATEHCQNMFGIPDGTKYSMATMAEAVHPDDRKAVSDAVAANLKSDSMFEVEYRLRLVGDETRWVRTRARSEHGPDGKVSRIAGVVVDVTDRKRMEAEVEKQERSLAHLARVGVIGELSGALAHELNQPLTAIMSNAQAVQRMLERAPVDLDELRSAIADIIHDDTRAGDVIRHLRALLKNDDAALEPLDLNSVVVNALELTRSDLMARNIALVTRLTPGKLRVRGDAVQLQQLLLNLIVNAADAIGGGPEAKGALIVVSDVVGGDTLHVSVSDTGPGITPDHLEKLFDPFFSTKPHGLGLGLSISRAIVTRHGGKIWAENNPGHGATFHISFPPVNEGVP